MSLPLGTWECRKLAKPFHATIGGRAGVPPVRGSCTKCDACQRNKPRNQRPPGLLQALANALTTRKSVSMDFIVSLPLTLNKHDAIMVMVDRFSKMVHFAPTTTDVTARVQLGFSLSA